jgi:hypothetical protein
VEPSTASQLTILAMRRSIFAKSSMVMRGDGFAAGQVFLRLCFQLL